MATRTVWVTVVILMAASSLACQGMRDMSCGVAAFFDGSVQCGEPDAQAPSSSEAPADSPDEAMTSDASPTGGDPALIDPKPRTYSILGPVREPGSYDTGRRDMRVLDALAQARGVDPKNGTYVYVIRALGESQSSPEATPE